MTAAVNLLLAVLCCLGHTALMVAIINRIDGLKVPRRILVTLSVLHDLSLVVYPLVLAVPLIASIRMGSDRLLWAHVPDVLRWYSAACAVLSAMLPMRIVQNLARRTPPIVISQSSRRVDVAAELGRAPVIGKARQALAWVPGNEILTLDVAEKHLRLPRLPTVWDGLRVLHLSDTHFTGAIERAWFEHVCRVGRETQPDLVVFTGDLLDRAELVEWLPETLGQLKAPLGCWFVLGNHDWYAGDPDAFRTALTRLGWEDASSVRTIEHRGRALAVGGIELPWMGAAPDFGNVPESAFRLLVSHSPDQFAFAKQHKVDLMLAGHTHGGQIRLPLLGPVYCPSVYGPLYCEGVFFESGTALHVTRGLSGETPVRLNCPPELALLVLRA